MEPFTVKQVIALYVIGVLLNKLALMIHIPGCGF